MKFKRPRVEEEIPASSMSDIAFLLLVFFIATTIFNVEEGLTLILPPKDSGAPKKVNRKNVMVIHSDAQNKVYADVNGDGNVTLVSNLKRLNEHVSQRLRGNDKLVVSIETHPQSHYSVMVDILDEVKKAEAPRISIKTYAAAAQ